MLNDLFTDSRVTKVMHGADLYVQWLQRDFGIHRVSHSAQTPTRGVRILTDYAIMAGIYIVGLFDTGQAARVLECPSYSLAHLLKHYCGVNANKALQQHGVKRMSEQN